MKKQLLLLVVFTALVSAVGAQTLVSTDVEAKNVVLEEYTGIHCQYCPDGHAIAQGLKDDNPGDAVLINIHQGGFAVPGSGEPDFRTSFGDAIANQANLTGYPAGSVNRHYFADLASDGGTAMSRGSWTTAASRIFVEDSPVNVGASTSYNETTRELTVNVELYYTSSSPETSNYINVALLQSGILGPQTGGGMGDNYVHNHMLRHLITGQWGDEITTTTEGTFIEKTYTYTIPEDYIDVDCVVEDCHVAVFVSESNQEIYSGVEVPAINGTTLIIASVTEPDEYVKLGQADETVSFDLSITNELDVTDDFVLTLTNNDSLIAWNGSFTIDGTTYGETATISLDSGVETDFTIDVTPDNETGIVNYTFTAESVSHPNAPHIFMNVYVMSNVDVLLVNNQGSWGGGSPADFEQDYLNAFDYAEIVNYTACNYKTFTLLGGENKLSEVPNLYFNVGWTFPSFTDENVTYLGAYLDAGGKLFVAGQDIGWDTWDAAGNGTDLTKDFYTNYLMSDYQADGSTANNSVYAYPEEEVYGNTANFTITDIYGGNMYPDEINPLGDAVSIFKYNDNDSKSAAVRYTNGIYKTVYLGFDPSMGTTESMNDIIKQTDMMFKGLVDVDEMEEIHVELFPNPANDILNIAANNASIFIYNSLGQLVYETKSSVETTRVNISDFNAGTYIVRVVNEKKAVSKVLTVF